jgi:hypothetical protein
MRIASEIMSGPVDMSVERAAGGTSLIDVLDRVLDKGIVIDAWVRVSLVGIDLITVEARVVVASIPTYLRYSNGVAQLTPVSRPATDTKALRFGNIASSPSALLRDDDDDDGGPDGSGPGGPPVLDHALKPRLRHPSSRERARRRRPK